MLDGSYVEKQPMITVGMPTRNNGSTIGLALNSLSEQKYSKMKIRVVIVDGLSTDNTHRKITAWVKENRNRFSSIQVLVKRSNIPKARNICLENSRGRYVLFWDADVVAPPNGISSLLNHFKDPKVGIVNHPYYVENPGVIEKVFGSEISDSVSDVKAVVMGFTMIRKQLFEKFGYFDERLEGFEDQEFCRRIVKRGIRVLMDPSVRLKHLKRGTSLRTYAKENFSRRSKYVNALIRTGSRINIFRAMYYILMPLNFIAGALVAEFLCLKFGICMLEVATIYMLPSIVWHLRRAKRSYYGLLSPVVHLIGGITLAYGMLWQAAKEK